MIAPGGQETTEFRRSFSRETDALLRRRLAWFVAIWGGVGVLGAIGIAIYFIASGDALFFGLLLSDTGGWKRVFPAAGALMWLAAYGWSLFFVLIRRNLATEAVVRLSLMLIVCDGLFSIGCRVGEVPGYNLWAFWFAHLIACLLFPWSVRQALIPVGVILAVSFASRVTIEGGSLAPTLLGTVWVFVTLMPGVVLCGVRNTQRMQRFNTSFLSQRYGMLRQELAYARQLHEALFPDPKVDGPVRFSYRYEPMRQIGGDYLYVHTTKVDGNELLSVVLLDVTGHGIPAALTVNRLHGEIELRFAEQGDIAPGEMLRLLNRYVALTLAKHSIFATAVCYRVDIASNTLTYASGGHPPAFIRGIDGTLRELDPTSFVLGACVGDDFDPNERTVDFFEGDSLIAYTDGAIESRSIDGKMFRIEGLRRILSEPVRSLASPATGLGKLRTGPAIAPPSDGLVGGLGTWSERVLAEITRHRGGMPPEDDTLVFEIYRPLATPDRQAQPHEAAKAAAAVSP